MVRVTKQLCEISTPPRPLDWLSGIRVVEVSTGVAGPLTGRILAELGADVIKVESRAKLDVNRVRVPREEMSGLADPETLQLEGFGLLHEASASKRSVTLNLKTEAGRELFLHLLSEADVFVQNFAPGWLERLGLSVDDLLHQCPRLVVLSATGYGQDGPLCQQRAYAPIMSSLAGLEGVIGYEDGAVVGASATAMADLNCSFYGAYLVLAALNGRTETGGGRHLDLSQTEACVALLGEAMVEYATTGKVPGPTGNSGPTGSREVVPCKDGRWAVVDDAPEGSELLDRDELVTRLHSAGSVATPVLTPQEVLQDPGFRDRGLFQQVDHPVLGELTTTSIPWHLDGSVPGVRSSSPLLGVDTEDVMTRLLGVTSEEFDRLTTEGAFH
ncbi:CaiB/BaiF CoA transferase family protein [Rhodococcus sp. T7]|uniref:CaiB/BaiF CoA transferase family protein n=1 Tax=Rhodococcus sp. T7 TaxID=627444 RepID=UPI001358D8F7|nr:CoA transferase [Rhodococcus sp. T7]KAF0957776.1 Formyl-CoA:oxalate CoA-transferase [Rhodococcus sp. T7]KAF0959942.1 Formyl-CoA:oxalate CoA-transferase [Rhodococcus sp. T7]